ncbi:hypothetical protein HY629_01070 [Candidatus Uhrbacteria bacterium]|nr:hypothetical protein [Candidatus Uhrbacteria bacterium]
MQRILHALGLIVLVLSGSVGCAIYPHGGGAQFYSVCAHTEPIYCLKDYLHQYFTDGAMHAIQDVPATLVDGTLMDWNAPFSFNEIGGFLTYPPPLTRRYAVYLQGHETRLKGLYSFDLESLIHEYLHVAWFVLLSEEERRAWCALWNEQRQHLQELYRSFPEPFDNEEQTKNPVEMWAYFGSWLAVLPETCHEHSSRELHEQYRGILRDELLDVHANQN